MVMMAKRLIFNCWKCSRQYSLLRELQGMPKLAVACPYCGEEGIVDLDPYRQNHVEVFRTDTSDNGSIGNALNLPDIIPTTPTEA
jgi:DNA-directed RNA polymerase subunit RPC12/RpoP